MRHDHIKASADMTNNVTWFCWSGLTKTGELVLAESRSRDHSPLSKEITKQVVYQIKKGLA